MLQKLLIPCFLVRGVGTKWYVAFRRLILNQNFLLKEVTIAVFKLRLNCSMCHNLRDGPSSACMVRIGTGIKIVELELTEGCYMDHN